MTQPGINIDCNWCKFIRYKIILELRIKIFPCFCQIKTSRSDLILILLNTNLECCEKAVHNYL